jgi:glycosyltransferase involved in cell wall biosynthesis
MYKILISAMAYDRGKSGISVYMNQVIKHLSAQHQLHIVILAEDYEKFPVKNANTEFIIFPESLRKPLFNMLWHLLILPLRLKFKKYDFIWLPAANRRAFLRHYGPTVATVHDLSQYHIPNKYDVFRTFYIKKILPYCVRKSDHIIAVSESTQKDLVEFWNCAEDKISVAWNGYDKSVYRHDQLCDKDAVKQALGLDRDFILYISRIEHPGKNHLGLLQAYEMLPADVKARYCLVMPGKFWPGSNPVRDYAVASPDAASFIFPGFIPNAQLPELYQAAAMYIFPSFFEGFGISLAEAMACGTPCACSNRSSLPEIGGDAVVTFDPAHPHEIADAMTEILNNSGLQEKLVKKGFERLHFFDWKKHAQKIVEAYEQNR